MKPLRIVLSAICFVLIFSGQVFSQPQIQYKSLDERMPIDPAIRVGTLPNGIRYYIKYNKKPEKRAELFLAVNAGAICEDPDQNGLAHFCEHMAFNGTKNFPKQDLVNFLESIGVKFGPDLNAYTSWDQTVYMLQIPTDIEEQFLKGFQVLEDWAHNVTYDNEEVDKERGVVIEEWRLGRGADERVERQHYKKTFYNSKYAEHDVIGDTGILRNASYEVIKRFYNDWYRPDLMAIIAVGDFDMNQVEKLIKERFGNIPKKENPRKREEFEIPPHREVFVSIAKDKELSFPRVEIYFKDKMEPLGSFYSYRESIKSDLFSTMLQYRLNEYLRKENPPFKFFSYAAKTPLGRKNSAFIMFAGARGDGINLCVETLLTEGFRVLQHGFTPTEFERAKKETLRQYEKAFQEKDKTESRRYAFEYVRNFLTNEPIPGIEYELEIVKKWLPEITLDEINQLAGKFIKKENTVIAISLPDRSDVVVPKEEEILQLFATLSNKALDKYVDKAPTSPLFTKQVKEGTIVSEKYIKELGIYEWTLSNGAKVALKPTDFKNDEILFQAFSWGGHSLVPDSDFVTSLAATSIISRSGLGSFNQDQLEKYLADKIVSVSPSISDYSEGFRGNSSVKDMQTLFEMIHLYFTSPRVDKEAFNSYKTQLLSNIIDSQNDPEDIFWDSISYIQWNRHFRRKPWTKEMVESIDMSKTYDIFTQRYSNASDFVFLFIGNFTPEDIKPFITKYIASLPSEKATERWKDVGIRYISGKQANEVRKGIEQKSYVYMSLSGPFDWSFRERFLYTAMTNLLRIRLREVLREDKSGVYGVGVWGNPWNIPTNYYSFNIYFGCDPHRVDELIQSALDIVKDVVEKKQDDKYLIKVKETFRRELEVNLKENKYWLERMYNYYYYNDPADMIEQTKKMIEELTLDDIHKMAQKYLKFNNFAKFVLYPEESK